MRASDPSFNLPAKSSTRLQTWATSTACRHWTTHPTSTWIPLISCIKFWTQTIKDIFFIICKAFCQSFKIRRMGKKKKKGWENTYSEAQDHLLDSIPWTWASSGHAPSNSFLCWIWQVPLSISPTADYLLITGRKNCSFSRKEFTKSWLWICLLGRTSIDVWGGSIIIFHQRVVPVTLQHIHVLP